MRWIAHVDMDCFYVAVERLKDPSLIGKPVVVGGLSNRGVISSASYEARKFGVRSAMPSVTAKRLCPQLIFVRSSFSDYTRISKQIFSALEKIAPVVEQVSIDEAYLDFTGCEKIYSSWRESAEKVKESIFKSSGGLTSTVAVSTSKLVSKVGSDFAKPNGLLVIDSGKESEFMAPLSLKKIPGVGEKSYTALETGGLKTCQDLVNKTDEWLIPRFGPSILSLRERAKGIDLSEVSVDYERKSLGSEETFGENINDSAVLSRIIRAIAEDIAFSLRRKKLKTQAIQVKFRYPDFTTYTRVKTLNRSTDLSREIAETAIALLAAHKSPTVPLRLLGVTAKTLIPEERAIHQFNFFESPEKRLKEEKVEKVKDQLKIKFGNDVLMKPGEK
ncbi:MAG: DNA polymerase IV [Pseudobdellovibrionaceae bacterium]